MTKHLYITSRVLTCLLLFFFLFNGVRLKAQVTIANYNSATGTGSAVNSLTSVPAGALLVLACQTETHSSNATVSSSPSLTWTKRADASATNSGDAEIWTAVFSAGGNITVTSDFGDYAHSAVCYVITNQETTLGGASTTGTSQSAPSVNITTTRANSIIIGAVCDWNAVNGSSRSYRNSPTETFYHFASGAFTTYNFYKTAASVSTYTQGLTAPTGQSSGTVLYEIRGEESTDTEPPSSFTLSTTGQTNTSINLSWTAATDNVGVTGYEIYLNNVYVTTTTNLSYNLTGLTSCTQYSIYVKAKDAAGNSTNSDTITPSTACTSSCVSIQSINTATGTGSAVNSLTSVPAGALLVVACQTETHSSDATVSSSPSLTWTKRADASATNSGDAEIWTAVFSAGGNITVTSDFGNYAHSSVCYVITNQEPTLGGASATGTSQSAPSVNITTTGDNSIIIGAVSDWNAINGSSRTYRDGASESYYHHSGGAFTTYNFYKITTAAGSYTEGLTAPTGQSAGVVLYEIRCAAPDTIAPTAPEICFTGKTSTSLTIDDVTAATDNVGVTGYRVYYGSDSTDIASLPYTITGLTAGTEYSIYVKAKDAAGNISAASNTITKKTLATNLLFDEGFENCDPWDNWITTQDAGHAWSRQQSSTHANEGTYSFRAEVRSGCDGYVSSGYRSEILPSGIVDTGIMWYGFSIYFDEPYSDTIWTGSYGGHYIQWHPDNTGGSATMALMGSDGEWDLLTNPGGLYDTRHHFTGTPITRGWHHFVINVNWSNTNGYVKVWIDGNLVFDLAHNTASSWYSPELLNWSTEGRYLKLGMNRWGECSTPSCPSGSQGPCDTWILYYDNVRIGNSQATYEDVAPQTGSSSRVITQPVLQPVTLPVNYELGQSYPNPTNGFITIPFRLPKAEKINLALYDASGRLVKVLFNGFKDAGAHTISLNLGSLSKGLYYYKLQAGEFSGMKKLTIR